LINFWFASKLYHLVRLALIRGSGLREQPQGKKIKERECPDQALTRGQPGAPGHTRILLAGCWVSCYNLSVISHFMVEIKIFTHYTLLHRQAGVNRWGILCEVVINF